MIESIFFKNLALFQVLTYTELSQNPTELPREPVLCITHPQMPYTLLCATCEAVICNQCHQEHADAQTHNVIAVDERVGALVKNELSGLAAIADNKVSWLTSSFVSHKIFCIQKDCVYLDK